MIGTVRPDPTFMRATSMPLMSGIAKSAKPNPFQFLKFLIPDHPLSASPHTDQCASAR